MFKLILRDDGQTIAVASVDIVANTQIGVMKIKDPQMVPSRYSVQVNEYMHIIADTGTEFLQHSCSPNVRLVFNESEFQLVTLRDIIRGELLTWNYCTTEYDMAEPFECECQTSGCYKYVAGFKHLTDDQKNDISELLSPFLKTQNIVSKNEILYL